MSYVRQRQRRLLVRLVVCLTLAFVALQSTLAFAIPCSSAMVAIGEDDPSDHQDEDGDCPCPLPCACCSGTVHAVPPPVLDQLIATAPISAELTRTDVDSTPPSVEPHPILHVPKDPQATA